jgi:hypothetical protein
MSNHDFCQSNLVNNSSEQGGASNWHGCVDHLLELVTGIAFRTVKNLKAQLLLSGTLSFFFKSSSLKTAKLLSKQSADRAVKPIQDVSTL